MSLCEQIEHNHRMWTNKNKKSESESESETWEWEWEWEIDIQTSTLLPQAKQQNRRKETEIDVAIYWYVLCIHLVFVKEQNLNACVGALERVRHKVRSFKAIHELNQIDVKNNLLVLFVRWIADTVVVAAAVRENFRYSFPWFDLNFAVLQFCHALHLRTIAQKTWCHISFQRGADVKIIFVFDLETKSQFRFALKRTESKRFESVEKRIIDCYSGILDGWWCVLCRRCAWNLVREELLNKENAFCFQLRCRPNVARCIRWKRGPQRECVGCVAACVCGVREQRGRGLTAKLIGSEFCLSHTIPKTPHKLTTTAYCTLLLDSTSFHHSTSPFIQPLNIHDWDTRQSDRRGSEGWPFSQARWNHRQVQAYDRKGCSHQKNGQERFALFSPVLFSPPLSLSVPRCWF